MRHGESQEISFTPCFKLMRLHHLASNPFFFWGG